jgi:RNA polymerase sigma-70 factor (ECF subfamily)
MDADLFEPERDRLAAIATRVLGSSADADDVLQEARLRLSRADDIDDVPAWLTTVVTRLCLDQLRRRRTRTDTETRVQNDPTVVESVPVDPEADALLAERVGDAMHQVVAALAPAERVAFVLHDVFAVPFDEIGAILGRSADATRQLASRARRRVQGSAPGVQLDLVRQRDVVDAFLRAARGGDFDALVELPHPAVVLTPAAAAVGMGSLRGMQGAGDVARALSGGARGATLALVEGVAGFVWAPGGEIRGVVTFALRDDRIVEIAVTGDAARIADLDIVTLDA